MDKIVLAYVPVIHAGYLAFFERHRDARSLYLFGPDIIIEFGYLRKDIRALDPENARLALSGLNIFEAVRIASRFTLATLRIERPLIIMPDEDECRRLAEEHLSGCAVEFDPSIFLRWDRQSALAENSIRADRVISLEGFAAEMMRYAFAEAEQATNLWRRVGAVATWDGEILIAAHNTQVPSPHTPYYEGDPRGLFKRGLHFELTTDDHAERRIIAEAARKGIALEGSDLFVTTFPCPPCGKQIGFTAIRRIYFAEGYAVLDSERILRDSCVEIVKVEMKTPGS